MEAGGRRVKGRDHFIAGMLHDIGKVILYLRFRDYFAEIVRLGQEEGMPAYRAEQELMGFTHADLGYELARQWELPPTIAACIAFHHRPSAALQHRRLTALVYLSDRLARQLHIGQGSDQPPTALDPIAEPLAKYVFAVAERQEEIMAEVESVIGELGNPAESVSPQGEAR